MVTKMNNPYKTILQEGRDEFVVSHSRFIGWSKPAGDEEDALRFIEQIRKSCWDASHNVWAYVLGASRERYSDDGEPRGTAGLPVLDVIRKEGLRDLAVVVTRYFGGVKLGAGGLVRAYSRASKIALTAGLIVERRPFLSFDVTVGYAQAEKLQREILKKGYRLKNTAYSDNVTLTVLVPQSDEAALRALAAEATAGQSTFGPGLEEYLDFPCG
jgi:uncharacterized YigZ family protein